MSHADHRAQPRIDARLKVTGQARYEGETEAPGLLHAALVTAPIPSGRVLAIDAEAARQAEGFAAILTHDTAPALRAAAFRMPLQDDIVHFAGQPVAIVLAETALQARRAAARVRVDYERRPAVTAIDQALDRAYAAKETAGAMAVDSRRGDPQAALAGAEARLERRFTTAANTHHPMEPHAVVAWWEGGTLTVHTCSQAVFGARRVMAHVFGLRREEVHVVSRYLGGGFGAKGGAWFPEMTLAVLAAREAGRPVRLELTRAQMFTLVGRRPQSVQDLTLGATRDGRLTALVHRSLGDTSTHGDYADPNATISRWLYACPNVETSHRIVPINAPQSNPMRGPGEGTGSFALESALDELAHELDLDPVELRLRNFADRDPHNDRPWSSNSLRDCYRVGAEAFGWASRVRAVGGQGQGARLIGQGMASVAYPVFRMASEAAVAIAADGRITVRCGTQDMGTGTYTVLGQLAGEQLGVGLDRITVELGDTHLPAGPYSGGSMATASFTPAVEQAARELRSRLLALAAGDPAGPFQGFGPDQLRLEDGHVRSLASNRSEPLADLLARAAPGGLEAFAETTPDPDPGFSANGYGAVFAEVSVDADLGEVRVTRLTAAYAAGRILNPLLARSQYVGGLICGVGMALHEATVMDERLGRIVGDNLADYLVPTHADMPRFDVHMLDEVDPHLPGGVKGIGMLGSVGTAAAIANAVFHATGRRIRDLPIRLERVAGL